MTDEERQIISANEVLRDAHAGGRCFILATGPSIKAQELTFLRDEICIAVSNFFVHPAFDVIRPEYYCIAPRHPPITDEQWSAWLTEIEGRSPFSRFFMGMSDLELNRSLGLFEGRIHYLYFHESCEASVADLTKALTPPQSVSVMALMVAVFMGFADIYLLGCDHSWILHLNESSHFYDEAQHKMVELGYEEWFEDAPVDRALTAYVRLWDQYKMFRRLQPEPRIFNLSSSSLLDVFPKTGIEGVVSGDAGEDLNAER